MKIKSKIIITLLLVFTSSVAMAHEGVVSVDGCHTQGESFHCHSVAKAEVNISSVAKAGEWKAECVKDAFTDEYEIGTVNYYSTEGRFTYHIKLYGRGYLNSMINFVDDSSRWQPAVGTQYSEGLGVSWAFPSTVRFEPSGDNKTVKYIGFESTGRFQIWNGRGWFHKRMFREDNVKIRIIRSTDLEPVIYTIPLKGIDIAVMDLIKQCKGKLPYSGGTWLRLPKHLRNLLP